MKKIFLIFTFFACLSHPGCGYTTKGNLAANLRTIYVTPFENSIDFSSANRRNIYLPVLEIDVRNAVVDRYLFDGNLRIADENQADLILKGELVGYFREGLRYTDNDDVEEYRVIISVNIELFNIADNVVMWSESGFAGDATYFVTGPQASSETAAIKAAIEDLAKRIVERTIEDW